MSTSDLMKRKFVRAVCLGGIAVTLSFAVAAGGASGSGGSEVQPRQPIIIGMPLGLTGFLNFFDGTFLGGARVAVADINASGGVRGQRLKIITADTKSDIAQGTNAALEVIGKGAQFVLPTVDYDFGSPAARAAQKKNIISITQAGDPRFGRKGIGPLAFNVYQGTPTEGAASAEFAFRVKRWRRPYILQDSTINYTKSLCSYFQQSWKRIAGNTIAGFDTFMNNDPSIASQITRLKATNPQPDFLYVCSFQPGGISAIRQIRSAGITLPILQAVSFDTNSWLTAIPDEKNAYSASGGVVVGDPNPVRRAVFTKFLKLTGKPVPNTLAALSGYSAIQALAIAIEKAGTTRTSAVKAQLEKFRNVRLAIGATTWTRKCHVPLGRPFVYVRPTLNKVFYVATVKPRYIPPSPC